jgi:Anti-sigma-K factor rskA
MSPDFDELVGEDLDEGERERLRRIHDLLLAAGPPPELSPRLTAPPAEARARVIPFPKQRWRTFALTAAAALLVAFFAGWAVGSHGNGDTVRRTVAMSGPHGAFASLDVLTADDAGNWGMRMKVTGLPVLAKGKTYALWLTKHGRLDSVCGVFTVGSGATTVRLSAAYHLKEYTGWVVVVSGTKTPVLRTETV